MAKVGALYDDGVWGGCNVTKLRAPEVDGVPIAYGVDMLRALYMTPLQEDDWWRLESPPI